MIYVHYAEIGLVHLKRDGTIYDRAKNDITIKESMYVSTEHRILPDPTNSNTNSYPDIRTYLNLEAAAGYQPVQVAQYFIVTMKMTCTPPVCGSEGSGSEGSG